MHGTSNATNTRFYYNNSENQRAEKDSDVIMQRKTNINGQKIAQGTIPKQLKYATAILAQGVLHNIKM